MKVLTAAEMREVDRLTTERCGVPSLTLMENAGLSVSDFIRTRVPHFARRQIIVLCGKGNNGGDGFVAARHLQSAGAKPVVFLFATPDELRGDAAVNCQRWQSVPGELRIVRNSAEWQAWKGPLAAAEIIVDALLGTGVHGPVEGLLQEVIQDVNRVGPSSFVVAVDIPSGLSADRSDLPGVAVAAHCTVSFTAPKVGMLGGPASLLVGNLRVREIGSPPDLVEEIGKGNLRWLEPRELAAFRVQRSVQGHKGDYGHALIVAGSVGKSGAAALAAWGALRSGAGLVTVATPEAVLPTVASHLPEIMTEPLPVTEAGTISLRALEYGRFQAILKGKNALAIGPGLSTIDETKQFVRTVIGERPPVPTVLDADGLNAFAGRAGELKGARQMLALTPHPGEMARLLGSTVQDVQSRRLEVALKAAAEWGTFVILKGHQTVVAAPYGQAFVNSTGNPGMATAGTGDVLTGMLAGLTAQFGAAHWWRVLGLGVYLHGLAGDLAAADVGEAPLIASDLIRAIPRAYARFYAENGCDEFDA